jgi:hypothetical protein
MKKNVCFLAVFLALTVMASTPAGVNPADLDGIWVCVAGDLDDFIVTIKGGEGILEYRDDDAKRLLKVAKGNITINGDFVFGRVTHVWGTWCFDEGREEWVIVSRYYPDVTGSGDSMELLEFVSLCQATSIVSGNTMTARWNDQTVVLRKR